MNIAIIDYGMGNLRNVQKALEHIDVAAQISAQPADLEAADGLILPGVGAFGDAMDNLRAAGLIEPIQRHVRDGKPFLGICLGLQLLFEESEEMGYHQGLGLLPGRVIRFAERLKVPHIGWNQLEICECLGGETQAAQDVLLGGIADRSYAYFVHSYYAVPSDLSCLLATTRYGVEFASVVGMGNVFGAQPHPEKSQEVGLRLLKNFAAVVQSTRG
ncbi:MAG: imidazole glycerol phosphate synthase subunit HisH [Anaerolineae bacterium]|nr:imidazole glycerol phosphate synthase subunit HisH [Anaerolineae bacterium]